MSDAVFTFSFKPEMREGMRREAKDIRHMITLSIARNVSVARGLYGADMIELEVAECRPAVINDARAAGLEIMGYYEGSDPQVFHTYADAGLDYINHNHLDVALDVLGSHS
jgi:glycerophosphoryl diester phosphodiesterase